MEGTRADWRDQRGDEDPDDGGVGSSAKRNWASRLRTASMSRTGRTISSIAESSVSSKTRIAFTVRLAVLGGFSRDVPIRHREGSHDADHQIPGLGVDGVIYRRGALESRQHLPRDSATWLRDQWVGGPDPPAY